MRLILPLLFSILLAAAAPAAPVKRAPARRRPPAPAPVPSFRNDVMPVLSAAGCYSAACHAKQGGQNGFQLSVLAFDPEADHSAIVRQAGGRRIDRQNPGRSLLLRKPTLSLPHAGGRRMTEGSAEYRLLARWISAGAPEEISGEPALRAVQVLPGERVMRPGERLPLRVTAFFSSGGRRDVTRIADFISNETSIAEVDRQGVVRASSLTGEAAVMVRYMGQVAVSRVMVPLKVRVSPAAYARLPRRNFIDPHVYRKLGLLNLLPSGECDDATFLRRAYLDLIGTLPTPDEVRAFLKDEDVRRRDEEARISARGRLVDELLARPEYADYWAMRWSNLLLVDRDPLFPKGAFAYDRWLREAFRENMPFDRFAREIVTASGDTYREGPANFYRALATPVEQAKSLSQLFLGVRIDCAQCHHHPNERWSQDDFYAMAAFFAQVRRKGSTEFEQTVYTTPEGEVRHPKSDRPVAPRPLGGAAPQIPPGEDRREHLARWMTGPGNPLFARAIVNRVWGLLMGSGLVEPVDDLRMTNPASNEALLEALARDFVSHGYDLKHLLRTIVASAAYQRSGKATPNNIRDTRNYSRYFGKRPVAEVLLDAVSQATGVAEAFQGHPDGTRAIQMWDNKLPVEFLSVFGRPSRLSVCECDRPSDGSITQALHLMNAPGVQNRLTADGGRAAALDRSGKPPEEIVTELYLAFYSRFPTAEELKAASSAFSRTAATRRQAIEDVAWALLNSPEFVLIR